jgi:hypothetical protein
LGVVVGWRGYLYLLSYVPHKMRYYHASLKINADIKGSSPDLTSLFTKQISKLQPTPALQRRFSISGQNKRTAATPWLPVALKS